MLVVYYFIVAFYLEIALKFIVYGSISLDSVFQISLFLLFTSLILSLITSFFKEKLIKIYMYKYTIVLGLFYTAQLCTLDIFKTFFSFHLFEAAGQVLDFKSEIVNLIINNIFYIIIFFIPLIILIIVRKKIKIKKYNYYNKLVLICLIILSYISFVLSLNINKDNTYSAYNLVYNLDDINLSIKKVGVSASFYLDLYKVYGNFEESFDLSNSNIPSIETVPEEETEIVYEYNNLDINFSNITSDYVNLSTLNEYFTNTPGTLKNEYTSMFEGKNIIYIMAETFNEIAVDEIATPTLYKLVNEGFYFENFYSPTIYSTIGGEFQLLTGIYPASGFLSIFKSGDNSFPFGLSTVFENIGYTSYAYHNNSYLFQNRNLYLKALGFDNFLACYNGLELLIDCDWLASDTDMINATFDDYKDDENFLVFYATVSGHGDYYYEGEFTSKYIDLIDDSYSEGIASYLAAQVELDRALEALINNLEEEGILEDTVIVLAGDHYPYYLDISEINEASDYEKDDVIEVNRSNLIIYNSQTESVNISKVASQIDILPTVYNLFGIEYDSRLIIGNDILSTSLGLAMFNDRSWVSDYGYYFASTDTFVPKEGYEITSTYVEDMNSYVNSKITASSLIMSYDYYKYIEDYFN